MKLESKDIINAPLDVVFNLVRDQLAVLVPHMPNLEKIQVEERRESPGTVHIVTHWFAKADIPAVAKKFIKPELLSWRDIADWNTEGHFVDFRLESNVAKDLFEVRGRNTMTAIGADRTEMRLVFDLEIYPERLPGVPRFLAAAVKGPVEELIKKMLAPNLTSLAQGLTKYFQAKS